VYEIGDLVCCEHWILEAFVGKVVEHTSNGVKYDGYRVYVYRSGVKIWVSVHNALESANPRKY
jgi:hypothetical protein